MKRLSARIPAVALAALCAIVIATGVVQYRWIDEASNAQDAQRISRIREGLERVGSALDLQVTRAVLVFSRPGSDGPLTPDGVEQRWAEWTTAPAARLVAGVTVLESTVSAWQRRSWGRAATVDPASVVGDTGPAVSTKGGPVRLLADSRAVFVGD